MPPAGLSVGWAGEADPPSRQVEPIRGACRHGLVDRRAMDDCGVNTARVESLNRSPARRRCSNRSHALLAQQTFNNL
jgi:hypothetical protein